MKLMDVLGFRLYHPDTEPEKINYRMAVSHEKMTLDEVYEKIEVLEEVLLDRPHANEELVRQFKAFVKATENIPNLTVKIGSLVYAKASGPEGYSFSEARKLSVAALIHVDKHPELLQKPVQLRKELSTFCYY
jgi:hypothetical protein